MPWTIKDVDEHKKGLSDKQKETWVKVANAALKRCQGEGGDNCEASAIKQASSVLARQKESDDMAYRGYFTSGSATVEISALDVDGEKVPVKELVTAYRAGGNDPDNDDLQEAKTKTVDGKPRPKGDFLVVEDSEKPTTWHLPVKVNGKVDRRLMGGAKAALTSPGGHRGNKYEGPGKQGAITKLKALYKSEDMAWATAKAKEVAEAVSGSLEDFAMSVKDAFRVTFKPDTISSTGEIGLGMWPRDVFEDDPELGTAVVVRADDGQLYAVEYEQVDEGFEFATRENWRKARLTYILEEETSEMGEAQLCENVALDTLVLEGDHSAAILEVVKEAGVTAGEGRRAPVVVDLQIIKPGPGNEENRHYWPPDTLKDYAHVFEGADIFVTDHKAGERSERTKVGRVRKCPIRFTDVGGPVGRTIIYDPGMAEKVRNRADSDELHTLHCSIFGTGGVKPGKIDGKEYGIVQSINDGPLVEFVSQAGAGGHAIALAENITGGVKMDKEQIVKVLSESGLPQDAQERLAGAEYKDEEAIKEVILQEKAQKQKVPQNLAESEVEKLVSETNLSPFFKAALLKGDYKDEEAAKTAIAEAVAEVKKLTGSGQVFGQGGSEPVKDEPLSEADKTRRFNKHMDAVGARQVPVPQEEVR